MAVNQDAASDHGHIVIRNVLLHASPADVCSAAQVAKAWQACTQDDFVWSHIAHQRYPEHLIKREAYDSWRALVMDDNSRNMVHALGAAAHNKASLFYHNHEDTGYYLCRVQGVELSHEQQQGHAIRLAYDARGERDLRNPTAAVLQLVLQPPVVTEHGAPQPIVIACSYSSAIMHACAQPGHYKGVLEWGHKQVKDLQRVLTAVQSAVTECAQLDDQVLELPQDIQGQVLDQYHNCPDLLKQATIVLGFQYGHFPGEGQHGYSVVPLVQVPVCTAEGRPECIVKAWRQQATYGTRGGLEQIVLDLSGDKTWWDSVLPGGVRARDEWWIEPRLRCASPGWEQTRLYADAWAEGQEWGMQWGMMHEDLDDDVAMEQAVEWLQAGQLDDGGSDDM